MNHNTERQRRVNTNRLCLSERGENLNAQTTVVENSPRIKWLRIRENRHEKYSYYSYELYTAWQCVKRQPRNEKARNYARQGKTLCVCVWLQLSVFSKSPVLLESEVYHLAYYWPMRSTFLRKRARAHIHTHTADTTVGSADWKRHVLLWVFAYLAHNSSRII